MATAQSARVIENLAPIRPPGSSDAAIPPSWIPTGAIHHLYPLNILAFWPYSGWVATKKCKIKYEKNTVICWLPIVTDPAKRGPERTRIELTMLDFRPWGKRALPAHRAD